MLCGDQAPVFTREEILKYTEPKLGYSKDSPGFLKFVNVLVSHHSSKISYRELHIKMIVSLYTNY